jgi:hypothetical protein
VSGEVGEFRRCADGVILEGGFDGLLGDSAPGQEKVLLLELENMKYGMSVAKVVSNSNEKTHTLLQRERVPLPSDMVELVVGDWDEIIVPDGFSVIRAFYGNSEHPWEPDHGVEITASVRAKCDGGGRLAGNPFGSIFGDVRHGISKKVHVLICEDSAREVYVHIRISLYICISYRNITFVCNTCNTCVCLCVCVCSCVCRCTHRKTF